MKRSRLPLINPMIHKRTKRATQRSIPQPQANPKPTLTLTDEPATQPLREVRQARASDRSRRLSTALPLRHEKVPAGLPTFCRSSAAVPWLRGSSVAQLARFCTALQARNGGLACLGIEDPRAEVIGRDEIDGKEALRAWRASVCARLDGRNVWLGRTICVLRARNGAGTGCGEERRRSCSARYLRWLEGGVLAREKTEKGAFGQSVWPCRLG